MNDPFAFSEGIGVETGDDRGQNGRRIEEMEREADCSK
jgi:hypothetical protein